VADEDAFRERYKTRSTRWAGHIVRVDITGMQNRFRWESQKERYHYEHIDIGEMILLKWILGQCVMVLTDLTQEMDLWREFLSRALTWRMPSPRV
jgi:hypothetical protein